MLIEEIMPILSFCDVVEYVDGGMRCLKEGEAVFNADHIVMCGVNNQNEHEIVGLCLQTSNLKGPPHTININLQSDVPKEWTCICSCKAGAGGKCKHIIACLIFAYRNNLEPLSCTDIEQAWGQRKSHTVTDDSHSIQEFCHVRKRLLPNDFDKEFLQSTITKLLCAAPYSEAAVHQSQSRRQILPPPSKKEIPDEEIIRRTLKLIFDDSTDLQVPPIVNLAEQRYFQDTVKLSIVDAVNIAIDTIGQNNNLWRMVRQSRITASTCYQLYIYCSNKNPNWENKINSYISPLFKGNKFTEHGIEFEDSAKRRYEKQFGKVYKTGVIVNPSMPWFAGSPDGLKMHTNRLYRLIEIKCPFAGSQTNILEVVNTLPYVKYDGSKVFPFYLNPKHAYYSQVQLSMAVLDLLYCDFILYSSYDDDILVIEVRKDDAFIQSLIKKLNFVYFNLLLPKLVHLAQ